MRKTHKNKEIKTSGAQGWGPRRLELHPDPLKTRVAEVALKSRTSRRKDFGSSKDNPLGNLSAGEFLHQSALLSLPWAPRAHKQEGGDPEISVGTVTRQQAAPRQGALPSPSGSRDPSLESSGSPRGTMGPLPEVGSSLSARASRAGARGSPSEPSGCREPGKYKGERGRGEGGRPGPPDASSPPLLPPWPGYGRNKRPLDPCLHPRNRGRGTIEPPHSTPQGWGGVQHYLVSRGSTLLSNPSSWFGSSAGFPPGRSPHTTRREQPKPTAEKTPNSSRPG
ncbi:hypothetical protein NN561_018778 [Cricetulus griseus]